MLISLCNFLFLFHLFTHFYRWEILHDTLLEFCIVRMLIDYYEIWIAIDKRKLKFLFKFKGIHVFTLCIVNSYCAINSICLIGHLPIPMPRHFPLKSGSLFPIMWLLEKKIEDIKIRHDCIRFLWVCSSVKPLNGWVKCEMADRTLKVLHFINDCLKKFELWILLFRKKVTIIFICWSCDKNILKLYCCT